MLRSIVSTFHTVVMGSSMSLSQQSAVEAINQWRSRPPHELIFDSGRHEISKYFQSIATLQQSNARGSNEKLISMAMDRLKSEFEAVLKNRTENQTGPASTTEITFSDSTANVFRYEDYVYYEIMSKDVIDYLRNIAEVMKNSGRIGEIVRVYKTVRKSYLQSQLKRLRFDELGRKGHVVDELKMKMELWIQVCKICVRILFEKEKKLSLDVFGDDGDECFVGSVKDSGFLLFRFVEEISLMGLPYDEMGVVLGVYDAFMWVRPFVGGLFSSREGKGIRDLCGQILVGIEKDVVRILYDLENAILHEKFSDVYEGKGEVQRSTHLVIKQIDHILVNKNLLTRLIKSSPSLNFGDIIIPQEEFLDSCNSPNFLDQHLALIILILLKNLKMKGRSYKDPSLGQLFVMNNIRCILKTIEGSTELQEMLGSRIFIKLSDELGSARRIYQTTTCDKFLKCLNQEDLYSKSCCYNPRPSKGAIRRRLAAFSEVFERVKDVHSSWIIPDERLREEVRSSLAEVLVPAYKTFLEDFGSNSETRPIVEGNKKHSVEDFEALVQHKLFANS